MNVLVTGGCGYLGNTVVTRLQSEGHRVTVFDALLYGNPMNIDVIKGDVTENASLSKALDGQDVVIHLAAIVGEGGCNLSKDYTVRVNYLATRNLSATCQERKVRLIFPSTASVYGARPDSFLDENSPVSPTSVYAITKLAAEDAIKTNCRDYLIFRLGTLFGLSKRMRFDLVVNRFVAMGAIGEKITLFGGPQFRPFIHLDDVADIFVEMLDNEKTGVFNLGGDNYRISDVANLISSKLGSTVETFEELRDPRDYRVNSDLAEKTLNVKFRRTIEDSTEEIAKFSKMVNYRASIYSNEEWLRSIWSKS
ncbi:MAG: NAD(P)-dependent oxidoreductase [Candidatus Bathyarchaeia archaeon]|jgi:nucleoside-diphosphate-sugar epimerase